jgi:hypothetical protein
MNASLTTHSCISLPAAAVFGFSYSNLPVESRYEDFFIKNDDGKSSSHGASPPSVESTQSNPVVKDVLVSVSLANWDREISGSFLDFNADFPMRGRFCCCLARLDFLSSENIEIGTQKLSMGDTGIIAALLHTGCF